MLSDFDALKEHFADSSGLHSLDALDMTRIPRHISCIMDGNGRWAEARGLMRAEGHKQGIVALREIITTAVRLGIDVLSAYAFSTENWNRPQHEVNLLMHLFAKTFIDELPLLKRENVQVRFLGDIGALPKKTRDVFEMGLAECRQHTGMVLALAVNYGGRAELVRAVQDLAQLVQSGDMRPEDISEAHLAEHLYTANLPDPELVIRTSGEMRVSNYLLYQIAYSEFYITDTYWPDFDRWELLEAIYAYQQRQRRFGGLVSVSNTPA
ncbi:isoprenyl transferase [Collinsella sp. zg1085]|uniref:isoprenyl transferase n=1 Tax=Collinsella sp. zg1085 TaxID=2844380 RepID=UPI001C0C3A5A|nr:isoprenyl transferase [Collinsella sp. zg1085]QWT17033.1 isoprenyl transferase [Collinsella sp. zg1085]